MAHVLPDKGTKRLVGVNYFAFSLASTIALDQKEEEISYGVAKAIMSHLIAGSLHARQVNKGKEIALAYAMEAVSFGVGGQ